MSIKSRLLRLFDGKRNHLTFKVSRKDHKTIDGITNFNVSRLNSCYWNYYRDLTDPLPITPELEEIFSKGREVHSIVEKYKKGAREIIGSEKYIKIIHRDKLFSLSGRYDFLKYDITGRYIEDLKSTKPGGFYFFLKQGLSSDYIIQLSLYAFLLYIKKGYRITNGVITKVDKENIRNKISLEGPLMTIEEIEEFIITHPVILKMMDPGFDIIEVTYEQMKDSWWKCTNCQYKEGCPIKNLGHKNGKKILKILAEGGK